MQMYYEVSGKGEPLVVLHGAYMDIPSMGSIIRVYGEDPGARLLYLRTQRIREREPVITVTVPAR